MESPVTDNVGTVGAVLRRDDGFGEAAGVWYMKAAGADRILIDIGQISL